MTKLSTAAWVAHILRTWRLFRRVALGAMIAVTTVLSMKSGESTRWSALSRSLP
jgi:hypothetical protein